MINNEVDRKKINGALQEASNSMTRIAAEKDLIKTILSDLSDTFQLPKKTVNKLARVYHKQNFNEEAQDFEELETLYEEVVKLVP
jgi:hypothetical protein